MIPFVIVGSGYRSEYFARVAGTYPALFKALYLCRSQEKADAVQEKTGIPATTSMDRCMAFLPAFAVIAVDRGHVADVSAEWVSRGFPVLTETPFASTPEQIRQLEMLAKGGAKIVCCEQYHRQPLLSAALKEIGNGLIGKPYSMYISAVHDYHAPSIIRKALHIEPDEPYQLSSFPSGCWPVHQPEPEHGIGCSLCK